MELDFTNEYNFDTFFYDRANNADCIESNCCLILNSECGEKWQLPNLQHYPWICLQRHRKSTKHLHSDTWYL